MSSDRLSVPFKVAGSRRFNLLIGWRPIELETAAVAADLGIMSLSALSAALLSLSLAAPAAGAGRPVLSGDLDVGERFTRLDEETDVFDAAPDDANAEGYSFRRWNLEIDQPFGKTCALGVRYEQDDRTYFDGFRHLDNVARGAAIDARFDPTDRMRVTVGFDVRSRSYVRSASDNDAEALSWEVRYRPRPNEWYAVEASTRAVEYLSEKERDRTVARWALSAQRPVTDRLRLSVRAAAGRCDGGPPAIRRRRGSQRSPRVSFRYEL